MNQRDIKQILIFNIIITFLFLLYIEISVGNIWFRINSDGLRNINLISMINFLLKPLYNKFLWNIQLLDINYIFIISTSNIIYYMFRI